MAISDFKVMTEEVQFPGGSFSVRGLSLNDVTVLAFNHRDALSSLFVEFSAAQAGENPNNSSLEQAISGAPDLVAEVIALAADDVSSKSEFGKLPFTSQLEALDKIGQLTFFTEGSVKKVVEIVTRIALSATRELGALKA